MNIRKLSYGLVGVTLLAAALTSCNNTKYADKAKDEAVKYLSGDELLKAERFARQQINYDKYSGEVLSYWDSLLIEAKSKEAYAKGQQLIKDSINGIHYRKDKFKLPLDTVIDDNNIIENAKNEYAKYTNAKEFINARNNEPKRTFFNIPNNLTGTTHYWNLITTSGKQKEAYQKGMADARKELNK